MANRPFTYINGSTVDANQNNPNEEELYSNIAPLNVQPANKTGTGRFVLENGAELTDPIINGLTLVGANDFTFVGMQTGFLDFSGAVSLPSNWRYLDGSIINEPLSPFDGQTLSDSSGRYCVGFGTDGGGDIGTAPFSVAPVGNVGHQVNLQHNHLGPNHTHAMAHTHLIGPHAHPVSINTSNVFSGANRFQIDVGGFGLALTSGGGVDGDHAHNVSGSTGASLSFASGGSSAANTGASGIFATSSALSLTQSIQPRSIPVRQAVRIV